jgi:hypothetical protein
LTLECQNTWPGSWTLAAGVGLFVPKAERYAHSPTRYSMYLLAGVCQRPSKTGWVVTQLVAQPDNDHVQRAELPYHRASSSIGPPVTPLDLD